MPKRGRDTFVREWQAAHIRCEVSAARVRGQHYAASPIVHKNICEPAASTRYSRCVSICDLWTVS
jgi:hypothetical protein